MNSPSLRDFVDQALATRRIRFGDLRRLQRDILPARIASREDAAMLIGLDCAVKTTDRDWSDYLVVAIRDFVVWGTPPVGVVDGGKAEWLLAALSRGGVTKNGRVIAREIARAAPEVDNALLAFARCPKRPVYGPAPTGASPTRGDRPDVNHAAA